MFKVKNSFKIIKKLGKNPLFISAFRNSFWKVNLKRLIIKKLLIHNISKKPSLIHVISKKNMRQKICF